MSLTNLVTKLFRPLVLGLCVASGGCGSEQSSVGRRQCYDPGVRDKIVFSAALNQSINRLDTDIYTVESYGSNLTNLTPSDSSTFDVYIDELFPTWSPDGKYIAYFSHDLNYGDAAVYRMNADGTNKEKLLEIQMIPVGDYYSRYIPKWSPDGKKIALLKYYLDQDDASRPVSELLVIDSEGTNLQTIVGNLNFLFDAEWSPDGNKLVYSSLVDNIYDDDIYVINADGSNKKNLTNNPVKIDNQPTWSPDGTKISFTSFSPTPGGEFTVFVMNADGSNQRPFSSGWWPSWSPDGKKIAVSTLSTATGTSEWFINIINATDGALLDSVNLSKGYNEALGKTSWSSDGKRIAVPGVLGLALYIIDVESREAVKILSGGSGFSAHSVPYLEYSPCL